MAPFLGARGSSMKGYGFTSLSNVFNPGNITYVSGSAVTSSLLNGTTATRTLPATVQENDFIIFSFVKSNENSFTVIPTGSTEYINEKNDGLNKVLYYKKLNGTEGGTVVRFTWTGGSIYLMRYDIYRGVDTTTPFDVPLVTTTNSGSTSVTFPSTTTESTNALVLRYGAMSGDAASIGITPIFQTGYTSRAGSTTTAASPTSDIGLRLFDITKSTPGAIGTFSANMNPSVSAKQILSAIVLRPQSS
jgi:hypothetical protein